MVNEKNSGSETPENEVLDYTVSTASVFPPYSVLMSVYEKENPEWFRTSIESMLQQTVQPEQMVIVEDGPLTKELRVVIDKYLNEEKSIFTIVKLENNSGLAVALNSGLACCRNEFVARMDSDDISMPTRCEKELECFVANPELTIVGSNIDEFIDDPMIVTGTRAVPQMHEQICKYSHRRNPFNHPTVMYRRNAVLAMGGYNPKRKRAQDYELFASMVNSGYQAKNINESLLKFRANSSSLVRKKSWEHCMAHVKVVNVLRKKGYASILDELIVLLGQTAMYVSPNWLTRILITNVLRK